jgi:hypothetical protein
MGREWVRLDGLRLQAVAAGDEPDRDGDDAQADEDAQRKDEVVAGSLRVVGWPGSAERM